MTIKDFMGIFSRKKLSDQEKRELESRLGNQRQEQKRVFDTLLASLSKSVEQNKVFNLLQDGTNYGNVGPMYISSGTGEYGGHVSVYIKDKNTKSDHLVINVNINVMESKIEVIYGSRGRTEKFGFEAYPKVSKEVSDYIKNYRLFINR